MHVSMNAIYRLSIIALLLAMIWMIYHEGERIAGSLWYPSEPLQVEVTNSDAMPVQIQQREATDSVRDISQAANAAKMRQQLQGWSQSDVKARAAANHLTIDEQRRMDAMYTNHPEPGPARTSSR